MSLEDGFIDKLESLGFHGEREEMDGGLRIVMRHVNGIEFRLSCGGQGGREVPVFFTAALMNTEGRKIFLPGVPMDAMVPFGELTEKLIAFVDDVITIRGAKAVLAEDERKTLANIDSSMRTSVALLDWALENR